MDMMKAQSIEEFLGSEAPTPRRKWKLFAAIGAVIVVLAVLAFRFLGGAPEGGYASEKVALGDLDVTVSATGNLAPTNKVEVGSEVSGLVEHIYVEANDHVVRGQVLARLDTSRLQDSVTRSEAQLASASASVGQARAALQLAQANLRRQEEVHRLSGGKVPSAVELDTVRADASRAQASLRAAEAQVQQARAQLRSDQTNLSKASIVSPVTGVVLSREIEEGQTVAASFNTPKLFVIAEDLRRMKLEASVDEADVGQVAQGQRASFNVDAFPGRTFPALIQRVNLGASSSSSSSSGGANNVISYTAVLSVANDDLVLRPGMTATADIVTSSKHKVLLVPNSALRFTPPAMAKKGSLLTGNSPGAMFGNRQAKVGKAERGSTKTVYILDEQGQPKPVTVTVGATNGRMTEVSGPAIKTGMDVITSMLATPK